MRIKRIHHLTVVVKDVEGARITFEQLFGERASDAVAVPAFGVRSATLPLGDSTLELATPVDIDNPVMRFLERHGEGFYNLALEVDDLDAAIDELVSLGVRVSEPVEAEPGLRSSFVTMAATHGLSLQLVEVVGDRPADRAPRAAAPPRPSLATPPGQVAAPDDVPASEPAPRPAVVPSASPADRIRLDGVPEHNVAPPSNDLAGASVDAAPEKRPLDLTPDEWSDAD